MARHAGISPNGAESALTSALGLWVQRYCAGLSLPWTSRDGLDTMPRTVTTNPMATNASFMYSETWASIPSESVIAERMLSYTASTLLTTPTTAPSGPSNS